ncbi:unnamed protein product, partial [Rotaria sp. Silwood2]
LFNKYDLDKIIEIPSKISRSN